MSEPVSGLGVYPNYPAGLTGKPFFTAYDLAARLQIDPDTMNQDTATLFAQLASDAVRADVRLQVDFVLDDVVTLYGDNSPTLMLPQRPVTDVTSVVFDGESLAPVTPDSTAGTTSMYDWRPEGTLLRVTSSGNAWLPEALCYWPRGVPVTVTYSHGWTSPPAPMVSVALELAAAAYSNPELYDSGRIGWVEWATKASMNINEDQRRALDYYRRPWF